GVLGVFTHPGQGVDRVDRVPQPVPGGVVDIAPIRVLNDRCLGERRSGRSEESSGRRQQWKKVQSGREFARKALDRVSGHFVWSLRLGRNANWRNRRNSNGPSQWMEIILS